MALDKSSLLYQSCYCEENVYKLCGKLGENAPKRPDLYAVFISNTSKSVPIWCQRSGKDPETPVVWDYHVILVEKSRPVDSLNSTSSNDIADANIYDLDTTLPLPCPALDYCLCSFHPELNLQSRYQQFFRVVPASLFLRSFASDRSHMRKDKKATTAAIDVDDGGWCSPPPPWPRIVAEDGCRMNLFSWLDMSGDTPTTASGEKGGGATILPPTPPSRQMVGKNEEEAVQQQRHGDDMWGKVYSLEDFIGWLKHP